MSDSDDEIAEDVLPLAVEEIAVPIELNRLSSWHTARKQFIRKNQWRLYSDVYLRAHLGTASIPAQSDGTHEIRYLTLPGHDFLDVEMLGAAAKARNCQVTSIGFLAGASGNPTTARAELRQEGLIEAGTITSRSHTFNRRLEEIATKGSVAYRELKERGPFHIINIDACGSLAPPNVPDNNRLINAIFSLLEYQFSAFRGRWLLFLTFDVRKEQFDAATLEQLLHAIKSNAAKSAEFDEQLTALINRQNGSLDEALAAFSDRDLESFMRCFSLGLSKWFLTLADAAGWDMKMQSSYCYATTHFDDGRATMPCLAFEFIPPQPNLVDPIGIGNVNPAPGIDYNARSLRVINKVGEIENLDTKLANDNALRDELDGETMIWLERIGYSAEALEQLLH